MPSREFKRKLLAILYADVAGYSKLTSSDEEATHKLLSCYLTHFENYIETHEGEVVHYAGDAILAKFDSVIDAVDCAIALQRELENQNADLGENEEMLFRIGINLGEVMVDRGDIYGNGVNVAARLETLAEPGGICISKSVFEQISGKMDVPIKDMGPISVKNIAEPVHAFHIDIHQERSVKRIVEASGTENKISEERNILIEEEDLYQKPSIAVLPFDNMSGGDEQTYFADGISEDIISDLSRYASLSVIARNSSFSFKGTAKNIIDIGQELNATYVVEGSVRKAGNKVRINVQLIDARNGTHLWADRYDRELEDVFAVQDEITKIIVGILPGRIDAADTELVKRKAPTSMDAHDCLLRGRYHHYQGTVEDNKIAIESLKRSIMKDPSYAPAYAELSCTYGQSWTRGFIPAEISLPACVENAEKAYAIDESDVECHRLLCEIRLIQSDFERSKYHHNRAFSINPNDPRIVSQKGVLFMWSGQPDEGIKWIDRANDLDPFALNGRAYNIARCHFIAERFDESIRYLKKISNIQMPEHVFFAAAYCKSGDLEKAKEHRELALKLSHDFTVSAFVKTLPFQLEGNKALFVGALAEVGFPE